MTTLPVRVHELRMTCPACPAQWEGRTDDGRYVYVRYRWGWLQIGVGDTFHEAVCDEVTLCEELGDDMDGSLSYSELIAATRGRVHWPSVPAEAGETP